MLTKFNLSKKFKKKKKKSSWGDNMVISALKPVFIWEKKS